MPQIIKLTARKDGEIEELIQGEDFELNGNTITITKTFEKTNSHHPLIIKALEALIEELKTMKDGDWHDGMVRAIEIVKSIK